MAKFCKYCGAQLADEAVYCRECGRQCADMAAPADAWQADPGMTPPPEQGWPQQGWPQQSWPQQNWQGQDPAAGQTPPVKKKKGFIIPIVIVLVVAALAVTALWKPGFLRDKLPFFDKEEESLSATERPRRTSEPTEAPKETSSPVPSPVPSPAETPFANPFDDVPEDKYYYEPVMWAAQHGLTSGTSFHPTDPCSRAQAVTMMWRAAGSPSSSSIAQLYSDVAEGAYYYEACMWAYNVGITSATPGGQFKPDEPITRAQITTFLYRLVGEKTERENTFTDVKEGDYFYEAALWALDAGIIGESDTFDPAGICNRGNAVTFLYRAMKDFPQ